MKQTATAISARISAPNPVPAGGTVTVRGGLVRAGTGGPVSLGTGEDVNAWIIPFEGGDSKYLGRVEKLGDDGSFEFSFTASPGELLVLTTSGRLLSNGAAVKGATVDVEFSANGTSGWARVGQGTTDSAGAFSVGAPAVRDGEDLLPAGRGVFVDAGRDGAQRLRRRVPQVLHRQAGRHVARRLRGQRHLHARHQR
ncbi:hypothetical protein [Actinomadura decatromicini]|uniref:Htaa domain-containing protein n=1 Tax=Actinomadura decatromicini TaxID=2604572 RepID=A0A5D3FV39_9ACTN|nr:hypothetical protein [Actinomadura decatromicini]TYK50995.1 hypothetical protein FXF68_11105 [Actinomadura decatromicini]